MANKKNFHSFSIELADKYGVMEAIFLHNLIYWSVHNLNTNRNISNKSIWMHQSSSQLLEHHSYFSLGILRGIIKRLENSHIIEAKRNGAFGLSYTLTEKGWEEYLFTLGSGEREELKRKLQIMKSKKIGRIEKNPINIKSPRDMNLIIEKLEEHPPLKHYLERTYNTCEKFIHMIIDSFMKSHDIDNLFPYVERMVEEYKSTPTSPLAILAKYFTRV